LAQELEAGAAGSAVNVVWHVSVVGVRNRARGERGASYPRCDPCSVTTVTDSDLSIVDNCFSRKYEVV